MRRLTQSTGILQSQDLLLEGRIATKTPLPVRLAFAGMWLLLFALAVQRRAGHLRIRAADDWSSLGWLCAFVIVVVFVALSWIPSASAWRDMRFIEKACPTPPTSP